jgi:hypothetical protein
MLRCSLCISIPQKRIALYFKKNLLNKNAIKLGMEVSAVDTLRSMLGIYSQDFFSLSTVKTTFYTLDVLVSAC